MAGKEDIPPMGVRSKTKGAGIEGMGYTCWLTRERMKANSLKLIVVVVVAAAAAAVVVVVVAVVVVLAVPLSGSSAHQLATSIRVEEGAARRKR